MKYLRKHGWLTAMAVMVNFIAAQWWYSYLSTGSVRDSKHGLTFFGEASYGHLVGITLMAVVLSYFFVKSALEFWRNR